MAAEAGGNGEHGGDDRTTLTREVPASVDPRGVKTERLLHCGDAPLAHAHARRARIRRQAVDVTELQPGIGHCLETGIDGHGKRIDHEPPADGRAPHTRENGTVLESLALQRRTRDRSFGRGNGIGDVRSTRRLEQRQPDVLVLLEADDDVLPDMDVGRITAHDGGGETDTGVLGEGHDRDGIGRLEGGVPEVMVHREADDRAPAGDDRRLPCGAPAGRADRHRRMDQGGARRASLDAQPAV